MNTDAKQSFRGSGATGKRTAAIRTAGAARLLLLLVLTLPAAVRAEDYTYTINNNTITITGYTGSGGAVAIPSSLNGLPVTSIGDNAFISIASLTNVTIPDSLTSIGDNAFRNCYNLSSVMIGNSVITLAAHSFADCTSLVSVTIPNSVAEIEDSAFFNCTSLTSIRIPNNVTNIGRYAFAFCTSLTAIAVDPSNPFYSSVDGVFFDKDQTTLIQYPGGKAGSYTIPNGVTAIATLAFRACPNLIGVTIPDSVTSIEGQTFFVSALASVTIGNGVTNIGYGAFQYSSSLTNVTIGNSVTTLAANSFAYCTSLVGVTIPNSVTTVGDSAFSGCNSLTNFTIPDSVTEIGAGVFSDCTRLASVMLGNSVTSIADSAFKYCYSLRSVTIPNSVTNIGNSAFFQCFNLTNVTIPNSVTSIGIYAFLSCYRLSSLTIPNSVTSIGDSAFNGCESLTAITIPNSITNIGSYLFCYCYGLTNVTIPASVLSIGDSVFSQCANLLGVYFQGDAPTIGSDVFLNTSESRSTVYHQAGTSGWGPTFGDRPTALWNLQNQLPEWSLITEVGLSNGVFLFTLNGPVGSYYVVEVSSDLVNWLPFSTCVIPAGGFITIADTNSVTNSRRFYHAVEQAQADPLFIPAASGVVTAPFVSTNGYIYQTNETDLANSGRAAYNFTIANAGTYVIQTMVSALDGGENSFYVNIDAEPQDPYMIWDIPPTLGFEPRTVSWRGNGTTTSEFDPKVFSLSQGAHQLIIRGREANARLQSITILQ